MAGEPNWDLDPPNNKDCPTEPKIVQVRMQFMLSRKTKNRPPLATRSAEEGGGSNEGKSAPVDGGDIFDKQISSSMTNNLPLRRWEDRK